MVTLVLLVDQVVGRSDVVVAVCLHAFSGIVFLKLKLFYQLLKQLCVDRHLLETRVEPLVSWDLLGEIVAHVAVVADIRNLKPSFGVRVKYLGDEIFALSRKELGHLVVGAHNLFVEVRGFRVFERQVACNHRVENHSRRPNVGLESVVAFASNHFWRRVAG